MSSRQTACAYEAVNLDNRETGARLALRRCGMRPKQKARRIISDGPSDFSAREAYFDMASWKFVAIFSMKPSVVSQG